MSRQYSQAHLLACLAAAEARYASATDCASARLWLDATHVLRDEIAKVST